MSATIKITNLPNQVEFPQTENVVIVETKKVRGRPKGSKNKPK